MKGMICTRYEFNQPVGSGPDPAKWVHDLGDNGWGNKELQYYTDSRENSFIVADPEAEDGRALVLKAVRTATGGYTSARLKTQGKFTTGYARIEARLKLPKGQGIWPAFWMLGANIGSVVWPNCGEIDIMEYRGQEPSTVIGTLHGPGYSGGAARTKAKTLTLARLDNDFHVYAVEWSRVPWRVTKAVVRGVVQPREGPPRQLRAVADRDVGDPHPLRQGRGQRRLRHQPLEREVLPTAEHREQLHHPLAVGRIGQIGAGVRRKNTTP